MRSPKSYLQRYKAPRVHVQVWVDANGAIPKGFVVDHKDGNIHNNDLSNLRIASVAQNIANSKLSVDNRTGLKGLSWDAARHRYRGSIKAGGKQYTTRGDLFEVACWLFTERGRLHGEFARHR